MCVSINSFFNRSIAVKQILHLCPCEAGPPVDRPRNIYSTKLFYSFRYPFSLVFHTVYRTNGRHCKYDCNAMAEHRFANAQMISLFRQLQLNKKSELIESKVRQQIETLLPANLREQARLTLDACKDVRKCCFGRFVVCIGQCAFSIFSHQ